MRNHKRLCGVLILLLLAIPGIAMAATGFQSPDAIIKSAFSSNIGAIYNAAKDLFFGLVGIEVVWFTASMVLNQREFTYIIQQLLYKIITLGLYFKFLEVAANGFSSGNWFYALIHGMAGLGESLGGSAAMGDPSSIMNQGLHNATQLLGAPTQAFSKNASSVNILADAGAGISALILTIEIAPAALFILTAYALMALRVFMIDVEMYFILSAGMLLLGTGGSRWTSNYVRNYINYTVSVSIRFFTIYFILGVCNTFVNQQATALMTLVTDIANGQHMVNMLQQVYSFGMDFFSIALIILMVPKFAANLASGQSSAGIGDLLKPAAATAGVAAAGAGLLAGGAMGVVAAGKAAMGGAGGTVGGGSEVMSVAQAAGLYTPPSSPAGGGFGGSVGGGGSGSGGGGLGIPSGGGGKGNLTLPEPTQAAKDGAAYRAEEEAKKAQQGSGGPSPADPVNAKTVAALAKNAPGAGQGAPKASSAAGAGTTGTGSTGTSTAGAGTGSSDGVASGASQELAQDASQAATAATTGDAGGAAAPDMGAADGGSAPATNAGPGGGGGNSGGSGSQPAPKPQSAQERFQQSIDQINQKLQGVREDLQKGGQGGLQTRKPTIGDRYMQAKNWAHEADPETSVGTNHINTGHLGHE